MVGEEALSKVGAEVWNAQNVAGFLLDDLGLVFPEDIEDFAGTADDVFMVGMATVEARVVYQDAVPEDAQRIAVVGHGRVLDRSLRRQGICIRAVAEPLIGDNAAGFGGQAIRSD